MVPYHLIMQAIGYLSSAVTNELIEIPA